MEEDKLKNLFPQSLILTIARGGFTCCVPGCLATLRRITHSSYRIPKDKTLRKVWFNKISRKDFRLTDGYRVCSDHFVGGKETYMNNSPLIVPKTLKAAQSKPQQTMASFGIRGELFVNEKPQHEEIQERSQKCGTEGQISRYLEAISCLEQKICDMEACHKNEIDILLQERHELKNTCFQSKMQRKTRKCFILHWLARL